MLETERVETAAATNTELELILLVQPEDSLEWQEEVNGRYTGWHDVESSSHLISLIQRIAQEGDWLTVQTKHLDAQPVGRYAQAMNTGEGYQVEVAQVSRGTTHNWRIGTGSSADDAGNEPSGGVSKSQRLSLAAASEVLVSWLNGHGLPLGYGAALHTYQ